MNRFILLILVFCSIFFFLSCSSKSNSVVAHPYAGTFSIDEGITFTLNNDSTTFIDFGDGINYESSWEIVHDDGEEWAIIEFNGNKQYYYLKNGKLYRSHMEMDFDRFGSKVTYKD